MASGRDYSKRSRHAVWLLTTTAALASGIIPATAQQNPKQDRVASATSATYSFNIPAKSLAAAIADVGAVSGWRIAYAFTLPANMKSKRISGTMTPPQAISELLAGTGLSLKVTGAQSIVLVDPKQQSAAGGTATVPGAIALDTINVQGAPGTSTLGAPPAPYAGGQVATGSQLGLLGNRSVMDTPFNVTSYTSKTVEDQQATSLSGVMNNNSSVRSIFSQGSYTDIFYVRGFSVFSDDTALGGVYGVLPREFVSTDIADRVEILNGPSALLNGISPLGSIGGSINIVPKRATDDPITRVTTTYNSVSNFGTHLDVGRRYGENNEWGVRFNGTIRGGNTAVDDQSQRFGDAVLGLDYRGDRLRVSADLGYQRGKYDSPTQPIYLATGVPVPKASDLSKNAFAPWSYWDSTNYFGVVRAEYDLTPNWTAFASLGARNNQYNVTATQPTITGRDGSMTNTPYQFPARFESRTAQAGIRGTFDTGPVHHSVSATASWLGLETGTNIFLASSAISTNLYNPVWGSLPSFPGANDSRPRVSSSNLSGVALADTLSVLDDRVQLTLGLRQQYVSTRNYDRATQAVTASYDDHALSPAAGLVVKPLDNLSLYANYIEGLQAGSTAPSTAANAGETFAPYKSKQYEAGVKYDWGQFTTTFSAFQIEQPSAFTDPTTLIYSVGGQQRNRGLEFNAFGEVTDGVRVLGGVTLMDAVLTKTSSSTTQGNQAVGVPHVQVNLGGEWDTPFIEGLTLTGRVIYTSSQYYDQANTQKLPDWTRFDVGARYTFERENGKPVTIRADVLNVAGKDYWAQASSYGLALGTPRTFLLSATFDF